MKRWFLALLFTLACAASGQAQIAFRDVDLWLNRSRARFEIDDLRNLGTNTTGPLRVILFATDDEWPDPHDRKALTWFPVRRLEPGQTRPHLRKTKSYHHPGHGWYWLTVLVQERVLDEFGQVNWVTHDRYEFHDPVYFAGRWNPLWPF